MQQTITQVLEDFVREEIFSSIDLIFGKTLSRLYPETEEKHLFFFAYLLAAARHGHLCIQKKEGGLIPSPSFLTEKMDLQQEIEKNVLESLENIPASICMKIQEEGVDVITPCCELQNIFYLQKYWKLETEFLFHCKRLQESSPRIVIEEKDIVLSSRLNLLQKKAAILALTSSICCITGGPGTGKTFTAGEIVKALIQRSLQEGRKDLVIKIAAPTGKAAMLLEKSLSFEMRPDISYECGTLHSLLGVTSKEKLRQDGPVLFADLFLVDEASMIDAALFVKLLSSLQKGGRIVLMGDKNQLPPVELGSFFADLIDNAEALQIPSIILQECVRIEKQELLDFAKKIFDGDQDCLTSRFVQIYPPLAFQEIRQFLFASCKKALEQGIHGFDHFRILSCLRKGPLGVTSLNEMILNKLLEGKQDEEMFFVPILITRNDPALGLMNGDTGYVKAKVSSLKKEMFTEEDQAFFSEKQVPAQLLPSFTWGYVLSVHKSQGSEYAHVIAVVPPGSECFGREALYTAITRGKKEVLLLGQRETLMSLLQNRSYKKSGIFDRLSCNMEKIS